MSTRAFDAEAYKKAVRSEWREAAAGWFRWMSTLEAEEAGAAVTRVLLEEARVTAGQRVLDVACGYGEPGLTAATLVGPDGHVTCLDIAGDMLAFAERRAKEAGMGNVEFVEGDYEALEDTDGGQFDAVLSRAGLMYAVDPSAALRRLRSVVRPGGRLACAVWTTPERVAFAHPVSVMVEEFGVTPPAPGPGVFALGGPGVLRAMVAEAGFDDVVERTVTAVYEFEGPADATRFIRDVAPPIAELIADRPLEEQEAIWTRVTASWEPYVSEDGQVRLPCEAQCVSGIRR